MGMSTWRCLPRTCLRAVASSVGKGESEAAAPSSGAQAPRNGLLGWTVTEGSLGRKLYSFRMGDGPLPKQCGDLGSLEAGSGLTAAFWEVPKTRLAKQIVSGYVVKFQISNLVFVIFVPFSCSTNVIASGPVSLSVIKDNGSPY